MVDEPILSLEELLDTRLSIKTLSRNRGLIALYARYYGDLLKVDAQKKVLFEYLTPEEKNVYLARWALTAQIFSQKARLDAAESYTESLEEDKKILDRCAELSSEELLTENQYAVAIATAKAMADQLSAVYYVFTAHYLAQQFALTNIRRFRWSFGNGILLNIVNSLPHTYFNTPHAATILNAPTRTVSFMTFILFYTRFFGHLGLMLRHTIQNPLMSKEEREIPWQERFSAQWQYRKHVMMNDFAQGTVCAACVLLLAGSLKTVLGYAGGMLTIGGLMIEALIFVWQFTEQITKQNKIIQDLQNRLGALEAKADKTDVEIAEFNAVKKMIARETAEKEYAEQKQRRAIIFVVALLTTCGLLACVFCPPLLAIPGSLLIVGLAGSALSFAIGTTYNSSIRLVNRKRTRAEITELEEQTDIFLASQVSGYAGKPFREKQVCFLEVQSLVARKAYQRALATYQMQELLFGVFLDLMIPALIFSALVLSPYGIAFILGGIVLAAFVQHVVEMLKPVEITLKPLPEINDHSFQEFNRLMADGKHKEAMKVITEPTIPTQLSQFTASFFGSKEDQKDNKQNKNEDIIPNNEL